MEIKNKLGEFGKTKQRTKKIGCKKNGVNNWGWTKTF